MSKPSAKPLCKIDGEKVKDEKAFYQQVHEATGKEFDHNIDSFNEFLNSSFANNGIDFVWDKAEESEKNLGADRFKELLKAIRDHGPGGPRPKDNVHLHLN